MSARSRALALALALLAGCEEGPAPARSAGAAANKTAQADVSRYLARRGVAADRLEQATRPPWYGMQRRQPPEAPLFPDGLPARQTDEDLCCPQRGAWDALTLLANGKPAEALARADTLLHEEPQNDLGRLVFARAARALGRSEDALREYLNLVARAPGLQEAYVAAGALLSAAGRHDEALPMLDRALALGSTPRAHLARGSALVMASKIDQAEWDLWKAVEGNPEDGGAYYALAWIAAWRRQPAQVIYLLRFAARDEQVFRERLNQRRLSADPGLSPVHDHPGFQQYLSALPAEPQLDASAAPAAR